MADFRARQRVQIHDGTDEFGVLVTKPIFVKISDGTDSLSIDTNGNAHVALRTPNGDSAMDDTNDSVKVTIVSGASSGTEFAEDSVHSSGALGSIALVVRKDTPASNVDTDGDYATLLQDGNGRLYTQIHDGGNVISIDDAAGSITVDNPTLSVVGGGTEATALRVTIASDSTGVLSIDDNGGSITVDGTVSISGSVTVTATDLDIRDLTLAQDAVRISANTSANSETNPIFVQITSGAVSGTEKHSYDTTASVAKDATDNHDYTVTATKTFLLKSIIVAASDAMKVEVQTGPVASLVTKAVIFTSGSKPTEQIFFDPPIEVPDTSTGTIRLIRRNDGNAAMDVYSTIIGTEV